MRITRVFPVRAVFVLATLLVLAGVASAAFAASPIQQTFVVTDVTCTSGFSVVLGTYQFSNEGGTTASVTQRINGEVQWIESGAFPVGSHADDLVLDDNYPMQPGDYTLEYEWIFYVNGEPVWRNTVGFTCASGVAMDIYTTAEDYTISPGCTLPVPSNAVVGEAPNGAQAYYEPGSVASGVFLNPGTYIVMGQDVSQTYYKVVLACQALWVRKDTMQPSFQPPQNGAALPASIVS